jgi:hypothetical protein
MDLTLTNLLKRFALPALSFVPLARDPRKEELVKVHKEQMG